MKTELGIKVEYLKNVSARVCHSVLVLRLAAAVLVVTVCFLPPVLALEEEDQPRKLATPRVVPNDSAAKSGFKGTPPPDRLVPKSQQVDPVRQAAWKAANAEAKNKVADFENAIKTKDPDRIRKAALDLQSDPLAVQHLNNGERTDLIELHNAETGAIKEAAKKNIQQEMADRWNDAHPNDKITADDVTIKEPTNYRDPNAKQRVGQDWDVTVQVRGKDVPTSMSKSVVEDSFFKAAGGEKTFGKGTTASEAAHRQSVEVTDSKHLESYKEPDKILGKDGQAPDHAERLQNPEDMGDVIEYKSNQAANKAEAARKGGDQIEAVRQDFEQMRQAVKQYDKVTDPRVKAQGGKTGSQVEKGIEVMREVSDMKISPEEGRAKLAEMGETPDSITRKAAGQIEAAQKLKPADAPKSSADAPKSSADNPKTAPPDAQKAVAPDSPKAAAPEAPKVAAPDAPKVAVPEAPKVVVPDAPKVAVPEAPKVVVPDTPKVVVPDAPKVAVPEAPKVAVPDTPKVVVPDAPSGKAVKVGGKVMQGVGAAGDALDIFGNAQDFTESAEKGDTEGMKEAAVNMGDAVTGGGYGTVKMVEGRAKDGGEYAAEVEGLDRGTMENAYRGQIELDLRRAGYSKTEADKIVSEMGAGNDAAVKSAYEKMGKEMPERESAGVSSFGEAVEIYGAEVKENIGDVGTGMKTSAEKAGKFLKGAAENLGEMATGVTETGVASELAEQVGRNVSASNLKEGYDAWQQSEAADRQVADARQQLEDKLVAEGARREEARAAADSFHGIGTESGLPEKEQTRALIAKIRERREKVLRHAEVEAEIAEEATESGKDDSNGGLGSFTGKRDEKTVGKAVDGYELMAEGRNVQEASTRGELAESEAKRIVETAGDDAQSVQEQTAAVAAAEAKATSLGKAVADGLQIGVETGAAAFGGELGGAAGQKLGDQIFGDPEAKRRKQEAKARAAEEAKQAEADKAGIAAKGKEKSSGKGDSASKSGKPKSPDKGKAATSTSSKGLEFRCPNCGLLIVGPADTFYKNHGINKDNVICPNCGDGGGKVVDFKDPTRTPTSAPASTPEPAPAPVKMKRVATHADCGSEMTYKGVYYADGTDMYSCPKCGGTYHNVGGKPAIIFKSVPDNSEK